MSSSDYGTVPVAAFTSRLTADCSRQFGLPTMLAMLKKCGIVLDINFLRLFRSRGIQTE